MAQNGIVLTSFKRVFQRHNFSEYERTRASKKDLKTG